ncbi:hypothetical protein ACFY0G_17280 [Streptomyces sp. NPDC001552]|uniref:hypothetical protein n=1 Tax=Streptomyces sp. NPDC001552 TaxID=3364587 RepID=UPI00369FE787
MNRRDYCGCANVQNYGYAEAAEKLGCFRRWLENNISNLPHQKFGATPTFCECELAIIQAMQTVLPPAAAEFIAAMSGKADPKPEEQPHRGLTLADITPAPPRHLKSSAS